MDSTASANVLAEQLASIVRDLAASGYCPATGGNFSIRIDADSLWMTASGVNKRELSSADLIRMGLDGKAQGYGKPSAETALHLWLYRSLPATGAVLHVHSIANTLLSRQHAQSVEFSGYEMQKAISGVTTHASTLELPIVDNSQNMEDICSEIDAIGVDKLPFGLLVRGHGLYAWGDSAQTARRHLEGWEFLLDCRLAELQLKS